MNPEQPAAPNYDFIFSPQKPPKKSGVVRLPTGGGGSWGLKIAFIVGGTVLVLIILGIIANFALGKRTNTGELTILAETQAEIVRVAAKGNQASDQGIRNAAISTQLTIQSQQQTLLAFLAGRGHKVGTKTLLLKRNPATDTQLTAATAASNFDHVFTQVVVGQLQNYANTVKTEYQNAPTANERALLANDYNQTQQLIKEWP